MDRDKEDAVIAVNAVIVVIAGVVVIDVIAGIDVIVQLGNCGKCRNFCNCAAVGETIGEHRRQQL